MDPNTRRRRDCHFDDALSTSLLIRLLKVEGVAADALSISLLIRLLKVEGGAAEGQSRRRLGACKLCSVEVLLMGALHHAALATPPAGTAAADGELPPPPPLRRAFSAFGAADHAAVATFTTLLAGWAEGLLSAPHGAAAARALRWA